MFVTGFFIFLCVFRWCHYFFLWLVLVQFLLSMILVVEVFFRIIHFLFHFSWNFIQTLSFGFSIDNSPFFLLLFVCFFKYEVHSISFQTFFVGAFKIVVDSWKFSMLLLYILWDDWPIFRIQLQMNSYSSNWNTPY